MSKYKIGDCVKVEDVDKPMFIRALINTPYHDYEVGASLDDNEMDIWYCAESAILGITDEEYTEKTTFPLHSKNIDDLLQLSDEQLGKNLRAMLEKIKDEKEQAPIDTATYQLLIPYSNGDDYVLAMIATNKSHYDEFGH